jgi:hypothetical protein
LVIADIGDNEHPPLVQYSEGLLYINYLP